MFLKFGSFFWVTLFPPGKPEEHSAGGDEQSAAFWGENAFKIRPEGVNVQEESIKTWKGEEISNI